MSSNEIDDAFDRIRKIITAKSKREFFDDLQGQIEEDEEIQEILLTPYVGPRYLAVTFDRYKNDTAFSYSHFDSLILMLSIASRGTHIYKPVNQMRVLQWNSTKRQLLRTLRRFARLDPRVRFRRMLILPFPIPAVGYQINMSPYIK